jgi:hypothetical protein
MEEIRVAIRIQLRRDLEDDWFSDNPILALGEIGISLDLNTFKIGDGETPWRDLDYALSGTLSEYIPLNQKSVAGGVASLDSSGFVPSSQLPPLAKVTVSAVANQSARLALTAESGDIAIQADNGKAYVLSASPASTAENWKDISGISEASAAATYATIANLSLKSPIDSPEFTGTVILPENTVSQSMMKVNSVGSDEIIPLSIDSINIAANAIIESKIASGAVTSSKIANNTIMNMDISPSADISMLKISGLTEQLDSKAPIANPTFIGTVSGITKNMVGLQFVDNVPDLSKPLSNEARAALATKIDSETAALTYSPINSPSFTGTVSGITKSHVGLSDVDNTSDANKPVSTAQALAIATAKSEAIVDATSQLNAVIASAPAALNTLDELAAALGDDANFASTVTNNLASKAPIASPTFTGTVSGITKSMVGLGNVDNTTDLNKPISSLTQTALDTKINKLIETNAKSSSYSILSSDAFKLIEMSGGGTLTIVDNADFAVGTTIEVLQTTDSQVTIAGSGFTPNSTPGLKLRARWSSATLLKRGTNSWVVMGDLSA